MVSEIVVRDLEIVLDYLNEVGAWSHADVVARLESIIEDVAGKRESAPCDCEVIDDEPLGDAEAQFGSDNDSCACGRAQWAHCAWCDDELGA